MVKLWTEEQIAEMEKQVNKLAAEQKKTTDKLLDNLEDLVKNLEGSQDNIFKLQKYMKDNKK